MKKIAPYGAVFYLPSFGRGTIVLNMNLKELLQFAGKDGKIVIAGDDGEVKGIFMSFTDYQRLSGGGVAKTVPAGPDPEVINREILKAQLTDTLDLDNKNLETIEETELDPVTEPVPQTVIMPSPIKSILAKRAKDLFINQPYGRQEPPPYDLRQEVMDPTFGIPSTQPVPQSVPEPISHPVVETESDEEIKPNFDDI